jgi:Mg2+ and Co2+ transporter CorA
MTLQYEKDKHQQEISELKSDVKVLYTKIDTIENNHLAHIQKDIDRILYILSAVGLAVLGELFVILNKVF